jgi:hypothetical protein
MVTTETLHHCAPTVHKAVRSGEPYFTMTCVWTASSTGRLGQQLVAQPAQHEPRKVQARPLYAQRDT